jgi:hypothetical protein
MEHLLASVKPQIQTQSHEKKKHTQKNHHTIYPHLVFTAPNCLGPDRRFTIEGAEGW